MSFRRPDFDLSVPVLPRIAKGDYVTWSTAPPEHEPFRFMVLDVNDRGENAANPIASVEDTMNVRLYNIHTEQLYKVNRRGKVERR